MRQFNAFFAIAFASAEYEANDNTNNPPSENYIRDWLNNSQNLALTAKTYERLVGGLVGYILPQNALVTFKQAFHGDNPAIGFLRKSEFVMRFYILIFQRKAK